ncbi:hypothetical protein PSTT_04111, partial [Puccinia striiformis]
MWVGDDDPVLLQTISKKIEAAIKMSDAAWSRDWMRYRKFRASDGRLRILKATILSQKSSPPEYASCGSVTSSMTIRYYYKPSPKRSKRSSNCRVPPVRILTRDESSRRRLLWVGDVIDDDPVLLRTISEKIEAELRATKQPLGACGRDWVLSFIDQMRHKTNWDLESHHPISKCLVL